MNVKQNVNEYWTQVFNLKWCWNTNDGKFQTHMYVFETYIWNEGWSKWLMWLRMHMLKIKCKCECIAMDQYGISDRMPLCFLAWTFQMHNKKQCWSLDHKQRYPNSLQIFLYFSFSNPNQEDCIVVDVKCLVFLWFSQWTLVSVSRVFKTQYWPFTKLCFYRTPYQTLIYYSFPHHLLLGFGELMLGYVTLLD
jgi:hypothetical protein